MRQVFTIISFQCPECKKQVNTSAAVPEVNYSVERLGDSLSEDDIELECPHCGSSFDAHVQNSPSHCAVELTDHPEVDVSAEDAPFPAADEEDDEDDWLNLDIPEEPFDVLMDSYHRLSDIIAEYGMGGRGTLPHSAAVINRMVFASAIGAMEAFLGDLLINTVLLLDTALVRLLDEDHELKNASIKLSEIHKNPNIVREKAREYLAGLLYHNLAKISAIYALSLGVSIFPDAGLKARLMKAVATRHDIVHRNGKDKLGNPVNVDTTTVVGVLDDVRAFAAHIHNEVSKRRSLLL